MYYFMHSGKFNSGISNLVADTKSDILGAVRNSNFF